MIFKCKSAGMMAAALLAATATPSANALKLTAAADSSQVEMGRVATIRFEIVEPESAQSQLLVNEAAFPAQVEMRAWADDDTTSLGNGLRQINRTLVVQSFDSGLYVLPPFLLVNGHDSVASQPISLKVNPVDVSQMADINPIAGVQPFQSKWYDFLPDWITEYWGWILLGLLIVAGGVCAWLLATKKVTVPMPQRKRLPADVIAVNRLNALKEAQLWEHGQDKEYYTRLIDILRDYLQERFGINAMEMTSSQILKALRQNHETRLPQQYMERVVEIADYVKFAKVRPLPDDNVQSLQNAYRFVEETRPAPEAEPHGGGGTAPSEGTAK